MVYKEYNKVLLESCCDSSTPLVIDTQASGGLRILSTGQGGTGNPWRRGKICYALDGGDLRAVDLHYCISGSDLDEGCARA